DLGGATELDPVGGEEDEQAGGEDDRAEIDEDRHATTELALLTDSVRRRGRRPGAGQETIVKLGGDQSTVSPVGQDFPDDSRSERRRNRIVHATDERTEDAARASRNGVGIDPVLGELLAERVAVDAEDLSGAHLIALGLPEHGA